MEQWIADHRTLLGAAFAALGSVLPMILPNNTYVLLVSLFCLAILIYLVIDVLRRFRIVFDPLAKDFRYFSSIGEFWIKTSFLVSLSILMIFSVLSARTAFQKPQPPQAIKYIKTWRLLAPHNFHIEIDTRPIVEFKKDYRLMIACLLPDYTMDNFDNAGIEKSKLFEITGADIGMQLPLSNDFVKPIQGKLGDIQCYLAMVPRPITPTEIQNLRHLIDRGGAILEPVGMGGITVPMTQPTPDIPSSLK